MTAMSLTMNLMSSSNRTFMELKLTHQTSRLPESSAGSNRTFMELKYANNYKIAQENNVLIVPLWN